MSKPRIAIIHYSAPPVIGGVESVIEAHSREMVRFDYPVTLIAGRGDQSALPEGVELNIIPEIDSRHPMITDISNTLQTGRLPDSFDFVTNIIEKSLLTTLQSVDTIIIHNVLTKRFNLPLTAALLRIQKQDKDRHWIAWCHDIDWVSPNSKSMLFPGYPWDLLREFSEKINYVTVSKQRQVELSNLYGCPKENIRVVYNGVDPQQVLGLTTTGIELVDRLGLLDASLILIMPVRVTKAKNFEFAFSIMSELINLTERPRLIITGPPDPHDEQLMGYYHSLLNHRKQLNLENEIVFIYESGPNPQTPHHISASTVGDLYKISDVLLMTSHREGFGMPILEAGLVGILITSTEIPAAQEIGRNNLIFIPKGSSPIKTAMDITQGVEANSICLFKNQIRRQFTWRKVFLNEIMPLINPGG